MKILENETSQCVSTDTEHGKIIGALCIVEKMPLVRHPNGQPGALTKTTIDHDVLLELTFKDKRPRAWNMSAVNYE